MVEWEFKALRVGDALRHKSTTGLFTVVGRTDGYISVRTGESNDERQVHDDNYVEWQVYMKSELA